jgi:F-type H+-transporting ATPase subunit a
MNFNKLIVVFALFAAVIGLSVKAVAAEETTTKGEEKKSFDAAKVIFNHIADSHEWHLFELNGSPVAFPLPVIAYSPANGLQVFSASHFEEWHEGADGKAEISNSYNGLHLERAMKEKLVTDDGSKVYDLSITKNVLSMLIGIALLLWITLSAAKRYKTLGTMSAPKGMQNGLEAIIIFMRDEVVKPNLGKKADKFMGLILTIFFFIWINSLLGLLPGGANFTGNIALTSCLALVSFIVMMASSNKHFWSHLLNPPNVPFLVKILLVIIEFLSLLIKPVALMIRLFANMLAGHIVILSVISMIFIFGALSKIAGIGFAPFSIAFSIFMFMLELLVAAIQAFIFANLTAVFIGQAIEEGHGHEHDHHTSENEIIA